ncbi:daunorubicin ABC transporter ATP-binding protein [Ignicoccus pacificus DSM 13166]|uniref:Daunorubicin ABC transporter ATP-binding protein n=1 Tax=Ignicoccus pacificus DSM 13166 TaxID=940294 RepID=A0A977K965_9CREN|nr:daunorubicin ABC transporter ATP-binding protein [Ignicoccus pacificus DSM 13166]
MLVVDNLWKSLSGIEVLKGISLKVGEGEAVSLLGPNGSGKSTLLKVITGIYLPTKGRVEIEGKDPREARELFGYVPQEGGLREELSGRQNVCFFSELYSIPCSKALRVVKETLEELGISLPLKDPVEKYSGGMKKALTLTIAMVHDPRLLILDEPTVALDPSVRRDFWRLVNEYKEEGKGVLFATHYVEEAERYSDRVYIIYKGKVVAEGSPEELRRLLPRGAIEVEVEEEIDTRKLCEEMGCIAKGKRVRFLVESPDERVPTVVNELYSRGIKLKSLEVKKPSLEDVFIKLVGEVHEG